MARREARERRGVSGQLTAYPQPLPRRAAAFSAADTAARSISRVDAGIYDATESDRTKHKILKRKSDRNHRLSKIK